MSAAWGDPTSCPPGAPGLGAHFDATGENIRFRVASARATKVDAYLYAQPFDEDEKLVVPLAKVQGSDIWEASVPVATIRDRGITRTIYYGYRAWGPNWPFDTSWTKGTSAGFTGKDVDAEGNRFNPNKLMLDPYAQEMSHDPVNLKNRDGMVFDSGPDHRAQDTGRLAPKGIVLPADDTDTGAKPTRPLRDEIIYEVHVRGLTKLDTSIPEEERGTYRGAARKADYLKQLGVTAVEFLPVHESENDGNDIPGTKDINYWGYSTLDFFAPDRRYAADKTPGGPTREFKAMIKAFHDAGIKVYLDVVYNHTGEGSVIGGQPDTIAILSWRGLDNRTYYELTEDNRFYYDNTGVNGNFNAANTTVRNLILDSLRYWSRTMGVDGFRFDLAPILGNKLDHQRPGDHQGFIFDATAACNPLNQALRELPVRPPDGGPGVDLIAEPWLASGDDTQEQGRFPAGWAEWNDHFRDAFRTSQNELGQRDVTPGEFATRFAGSSDLYQKNNRKPWHSINFIVVHDGYCLRDLYSFTNPGQKAWDQGGDTVLRRQATRNGFAFPLLSAGVPMFTGGDEMYRTQNGNFNAYNVDDKSNYLDWSQFNDQKQLFDFTRRLIAFRRAHPALRPADYFTGRDNNGNRLKDLTWYRDNGQEPDQAYFDAQDRHFLAYRIDGTEFQDPAPSIYVGYNGWQDPVPVILPPPAAGRKWMRVADTSAFLEPEGNIKDPGEEDPLDSPNYRMNGRSVLLLIEK